MASEIFNADDPQVALNTPIAGQTTITFATLTYVPTTDELFLLHNGSLLVLGIDYTETSPTTVVLDFIPDAIGPDVDVFAAHTIQPGSSVFIPAPTVFNQQDPPRRPDNFGGKFIFNP